MLHTHAVNEITYVGIVVDQAPDVPVNINRNSLRGVDRNVIYPHRMRGAADGDVAPLADSWVGRNPHDGQSGHAKRGRGVNRPCNKWASTTTGRSALADVIP